LTTNFEDIQQSVIEVKNHRSAGAGFHDFDSRAYFTENRRRSWRA
jgi:hypothetical protein